MKHVTVMTRVIKRKVCVLSLDHEGVPLDTVYVGTWQDALKERNRRLEAWSGKADKVTATPMPVIDLDVRRY